LKAYQILLAILSVWILTGCNPSPSTPALPLPKTSLTDQSQEATAEMPSTHSSQNPVSPINTLDFSEVTPPPADTNPFVKLAEEDLANRLTITTDQIHFLKISDIDWQDITQGCTASPGQTLTKRRVSGYRIWLEANGKNYLYHIGLDNTIFLCPD
jgi:hypothetical protein